MFVLFILCHCFSLVDSYKQHVPFTNKTTCKMRNSSLMKSSEMIKGKLRFDANYWLPLIHLLQSLKIKRNFIASTEFYFTYACKH